MKPRAFGTPVSNPLPSISTSEAVSDWDDKLAELYTWTGSEFVEDKPELYKFLCSLIGYLLSGRDYALSRISTDDEAVVEKVADKLIEADAVHRVAVAIWKASGSRGAFHRKAYERKARAAIQALGNE